MFYFRVLGWKFFVGYFRNIFFNILKLQEDVQLQVVQLQVYSISLSELYIKNSFVLNVQQGFNVN